MRGAYHSFHLNGDPTYRPNTYTHTHLFDEDKTNIYNLYYKDHIYSPTCCNSLLLVL